MTENLQYITALIGKHLQGTISSSELSALENWCKASEHNQRVFNELKDEPLTIIHLKQFYQFDTARITEKIGTELGVTMETEVELPVEPPVTGENYLTKQEPATVYNMNWRRRWGWVAAVIVLCVGGVYMFSEGRKVPRQLAATQNVKLLPGKEGAILTLSDGSQMVLDSLGNGVVASQNGADVILENGKLQYELAETASLEGLYNTMTTPKGRQFRITLSDGTKVWLNAGSSIRYPLGFGSQERKVTITGEAYFEVAKNPEKPFRVNANNSSEIEVLGTHFNVNAYENEKGVTTTLIEGKVEVSTPVTDRKFMDAPHVVLEPGQQAVVLNTMEAVNNVGRGVGQDSNGGRTKAGSGNERDIIRVVKNPDIDKVMAWKHGLFNFENAGLEEVMRQLERWYDIEVVYENGIPEARFWGEMSRQISLEDLLVILRETDVNFRIEEGRKLVVLNK